MRARTISLLPFLSVALVIVLVPMPASNTPMAHAVTLKAEQFAFDPPVLRVNQGDRVSLVVQATDVVHGVYLDYYGIDVRVEPGISQEVEFIADRTGKFRYRCSVACGTLHPFMIGELVVRPNRPYMRAVGLSLVALAATMFYLWRFPPQPSRKSE